MDKNRMFEGDWNPYDLLIELSEKLRRMEYAHNALANDYMKTQQDLQTALQSIHSLQKGHLALSKVVTETTINNLSNLDKSKVPGKY